MKYIRPIATIYDKSSFKKNYVLNCRSIVKYENPVLATWEKAKRSEYNSQMMFSELSWNSPVWRFLWYIKRHQILRSRAVVGEYQWILVACVGFHPENCTNHCSNKHRYLQSRHRRVRSNHNIRKFVQTTKMLRPGVSTMTKDSDVAPTKLDRIKRVVQNAIQLNKQSKKILHHFSLKHQKCDANR